MSFGGSGTSGTLAHLHNNLANEGGSLDNTSLINDRPIFSMVISLG